MRDRRDVLGGAVILALSIGFAGIGLQYPTGTLLRMGPGFFPLATSVVLGALGLGIMLNARNEVPADSAPSPKAPVPWRPTVAVLASILVFALSLERLGLVLSTALLVGIAALAEPRLRPLRTFALALALAVIGVLVFVEGLGIPIPVFRWSL